MWIDQVEKPNSRFMSKLASDVIDKIQSDAAAGKFQNGKSNYQYKNETYKSYKSNRMVGKTGAAAADNNIKIYIDDKLIKWQDGQSYRIVFEDLDLDGNSIKIYTNWADSFNKLIGTISATDAGTDPYFEIVCLNAATFEFEIDMIR